MASSSQVLNAYSDTDVYRYESDIIEYPYTEKNLAFSYQNINQHCPKKKYVRCGGFDAYWTTLAKNYIFFKSNAPSSQGNITKTQGWKLHISLLDKDDGHKNLERGWQITYNILSKYNVSLSKIIQHSARTILRNDLGQCGKTISIYCFKEPDRLQSEWAQIITEITDEFVRQNILPGPLPSSDITISGSQYFSYRNDAPISSKNSMSSSSSKKESSSSADSNEIKLDLSIPINNKTPKQIIAERIATPSSSPENHYTQYDIIYNESEDSAEENVSLLSDPFKGIYINVANQPLRQVINFSSSLELNVMDDEKKITNFLSNEEDTSNGNSPRDLKLSSISSTAWHTRKNDNSYQTSNSAATYTSDEATENKQLHSQHLFYKKNESRISENYKSWCPPSKCCLIL